jgi:type I restriction-modification system DNA methylase subunit
MKETKDRIKGLGEVYTPRFIVEEMLDLNLELSYNINTTYLEPTCGNGNFLDEILRRKLSNCKDLEDIKTSFRNIYGADICPSNVEDTKQRLLLIVKEVFNDLTDDFIDELKDILLLNIIVQDSLKENLFENYKFDVIIGNPPYQEMDGGFGASAKPLYQKFILQAIDMNCRYISFIVPARFLTGGKGLDKFRKFILNYPHIKFIKDFKSSKEVFKNVDIAGGVIYFLIDKEFTGLTTFEEYYKGETLSIKERVLNEFDIFVRDNKGVDILKKILVNYELIDSELKG